MADNVGAYSQDVLTRITNVNWGGGGIYVTGSQLFFTNEISNVFTNIASKDDDDLTNWNVTFSSPRGDGFMMSEYPGSSLCAAVSPDPEKPSTPIFVLGGLNDQDDKPRAAMMLTSSDGKTWTPKTFVESGEVYLLTWDEAKKAIYAGMRDYSKLTEEHIIYDVVLASSDGLTWTEAERKPDAGYWSSPVEKYCSDKVKDVHGNNVPTSVFGYDDRADILITPDPVSISFGVSYPIGEKIQHGFQLKIIRGPANEFPGSETMALPAGMDRVWAVAYAAGIWQAAGQAGDDPGSGVVATSVDDGATWEITLVTAAGYVFSSMAAGSAGSVNAGL